MPTRAERSTKSTRASGAGPRRASPAPEAEDEHRNEVLVRGRLAAVPTTKVLPSGDEIAIWRLVVDRADPSGSQRVDVVDCSTFGARVRRQAAGWTEGEVIEVTGALRRRFWRAGNGVQSRCEVEVASASRQASRPRAGAPAGGGRRRAAK